MARITVEDCLENVDNRFDLVIKASRRARELELSGADPMVDPDGDKPTVIALREIAKGYDVSKKAAVPREIDILSASYEDKNKHLNLSNMELGVPYMENEDDDDDDDDDELDDDDIAEDEDESTEPNEEDANPEKD